MVFPLASVETKGETMPRREARPKTKRIVRPVRVGRTKLAKNPSLPKLSMTPRKWGHCPKERGHDHGDLLGPGLVKLPFDFWVLWAGETKTFCGGFL